MDYDSYYDDSDKPQVSPTEIIAKLRTEDQRFNTAYKNVITCINAKTPDVYDGKIWKLYDDIDYLEDTYADHVPSVKILFPRIAYMQEFYEEAHKLVKKYDSDYESKLQVFDTESTNGYKLLTIENGGTCFMNRTQYENFAKWWVENPQYTQTKFLDTYDAMACREWGMIDPNGEKYAVYYRYPEGSEEAETILSLNKKANGIALWILPYPKQVILETIKYSVNDIQKSVRYSNFLCEWVKRKMKQMAEIENQKLKKELEAAIIAESKIVLPPVETAAKKEPEATIVAENKTTPSDIASVAFAKKKLTKKEIEAATVVENKVPTPEIMPATPAKKN